MNTCEFKQELFVIWTHVLCGTVHEQRKVHSNDKLEYSSIYRRTPIYIEYKCITW